MSMGGRDRWGWKTRGTRLPTQDVTAARRRSAVAASTFEPTVLDDEWDARASRRIPSLALPFALLGGAAGFFSTLGLSVVLPDVRSTPPLMVGGVAVVVGALLGVVLRRWRRLHAPLVSRDIKLAAVVALLVTAGAVVSITSIGIMFSGIWWRHPVEAGLEGAFPALLFLPSCLAILDAGRRAARARLGSLVASVDRRTIVVTVTSAIVFCALVQLPAVLFGVTSRELPRVAQLLVSIAVTSACLVVLVLGRRKDIVARAQLEALVREVDPLEGLDVTEDRHVLDLGVGGDRWGRLSGVATYRAAERREVLLCGSIAEARAAMDDALSRRQRAIRFATFAALASAGAGLVNAVFH